MNSVEPAYGALLAIWASSPDAAGLAVYAAIAALSIAFPFAVRVYQRRRSRDWPTTGGRIESTRVVVQQRGRHKVLVGEVAYSYSVNGEYYAGFLTKDGGSEAKLEAWTSRFTVGQSVLIRYHPKRAEVSFLNERDQIAMMASRPG